MAVNALRLVVITHLISLKNFLRSGDTTPTAQVSARKGLISHRRRLLRIDYELITGRRFFHIEFMNHQTTGEGSARQISAAYSRIVRSLENRPELATFMIALRAQPPASA